MTKIVNQEGGPADSAWEQCLVVTSSIGKKADKNKRRARYSALATTIFSSTIPILLAFGNGSVSTRIIASSLAAVTVVITTWVQIEKPNERWVLYRRYHRLLESEQIRYKFEIEPYEIEREARLAEFLASIQSKLHLEWEGLIPSSEAVRGSTATTKGLP